MTAHPTTGYTMTVGGGPAPAPARFGVVDPATGEVFADAPACDRRTLDAAADSAAAAFAGWSRDEVGRRDALRAAAGVLDRERDRLARLLTTEQGKPLPEAREEIGAAAVWLRYFATLALPEPLVRQGSSHRAEVTRHPYGVVAAIAPWNYPVLLAVWKVAPALLAGNTVVLKPSPVTPLSTLLLGDLLRDHLPPGVLNVVAGPEPLGEWLVGHPVPRKVSVTGSTGTGRAVARAAAADLKRLTLELGGNDPAIVLPDADPGRVAGDLFRAAFLNGGQVCHAVKRVYAPTGTYEAVVAALAERARAARLGHGLDPDTDLGPCTTRRQADRMADLVAAATAAGARVAAGGYRPERPGHFYAPTVLAGADDGMAVVDEEQFGPVLPVVAYRDVTDAVDRANASRYGLTASVWGEDVDRALAVARRLDCGQVSVNAHGAGLRPDLPFGGHKWSGIGVENGTWALDEYTQPRVVLRPRR